MNGHSRKISSFLKKEIPFFFLSLRRNFVMLFLALPEFLAVLSVYNNYLSVKIFYYLKKITFFIRYNAGWQSNSSALYKEEVDIYLAFFLNTMLVTLLVGGGVLYVFRSIVSRFAFSSFKFIRSGKVGDDLKFFGSWLYGSIFLSLLLNVCYIKIIGGSGRFLAYIPRYNFTDWFIFYIIQFIIYYIMVRQKCFGYNLRKHESKSIYFHIARIIGRCLDILRCCIYLIKSLFQWLLWLFKNFKEERSLFSLIVWHNYVFTMFSAIPIYIIGLIWERYADLICHGNKNLIFAVGYLGSLIVTTCCLFFMMRYVITAYIPKNFVFTRTERLQDDVKFYFFPNDYRIFLKLHSDDNNRSY